MLKKYLVIFLVFIVIDAIWLGLVAPKMYQKEIGHLMADKVNFIPAIIFYLIYALAILVFVVDPALAKGDWVKALVYGAFLGLTMYATYDLTNNATLKDWPVKVTIIDLIWGSFVTSATSVIATKLIQYFNF